MMCPGDIISPLCWQRAKMLFLAIFISHLSYLPTKARCQKSQTEREGLEDLPKFLPHGTTMLLEIAARAIPLHPSSLLCSLVLGRTSTRLPSWDSPSKRCCPFRDFREIPPLRKIGIFSTERGQKDVIGNRTRGDDKPSKDFVIVVCSMGWLRDDGIVAVQIVDRV